MKRNLARQSGFAIDISSGTDKIVLMTLRQRFQATIAHRQPDRVPLDLGATSLTAMRPELQQKLAEVLGLPGKPRRVNNRFDERIMEWAGTARHDWFWQFSARTRI